MSSSLSSSSSPAPESVRTILFALAFLGIWFPIPFWAVASIMTCISLRSAPPSHAKRGMIGTAILVPCLLAIFIIAMILSSVFTAYYSKVLVKLQIISGVVLPIYAIVCAAFIACADATFRSTHGSAVATLSDPRYLRGVNLGVNLAGLFCFPWLFSLVGIPLTLVQLKKHRQRASGYGASLGLGITTYVLLICTILTVIISGAVRVPSRYYYSYNYGSSSSSIDIGQSIIKRHILQADMWNPNNDACSASTTLLSDCGASISNCVTGRTTIDGICPCYSSYLRCFDNAKSGFDSCPSVRDTLDMTRTSFVKACQQICNAGCSGDIDDVPTESAINGAGAIIALATFASLYFVFNIAFIAVSDAMILRLIEPTPTTVVAGAQLVHPCPNCAAPLQFSRTGATTQVQCYQCSSVVEFQTA